MSYIQHSQHQQRHHRHQAVYEDEQQGYQPSPNIRYRNIRLYQSLDQNNRISEYYQQFKAADKMHRDERLNQVIKLHRKNVQANQKQINEKIKKMAILQQPIYQQKRDPRPISLRVHKTIQRKRIVAPRKILTSPRGEAMIGHRKSPSGQKNQKEKQQIKVQRQLRTPNREVELVQNIKQLQLISVYGIQQFGSIEMAEKIFTKFSKKYKEYKAKGVQIQLQREQDYEMIVKILDEKRKKGYNQYIQILRTLSSLRTPSQIIRFIKQEAEKFAERIQWASSFVKISQKMLKMFCSQQLNNLLTEWEIILQKIIQFKRVSGVIILAQERTINVIEMYPLNAKLSINIKKQIHSDLKDLVYILWKPFDNQFFEAELYFKLRVCLNQIIDTQIIKNFANQQEDTMSSWMLTQMLASLKRSILDQRNDILKFNNSYPQQQPKVIKISPRKRSMFKSMVIQESMVHCKIDNIEQYNQKLDKLNAIFDRYINSILRQNTEDIYQSFIDFQIQRYEKKHLIQKKWDVAKSTFKAIQNCLVIHQRWSQINNILFKTYMEANQVKKSIYHNSAVTTVNFRTKMTTLDSLVQNIKQGRAKNADQAERIICSYYRNSWALTKEMFAFMKTPFVLISFQIMQEQSKGKSSAKVKTEEIMMIGLNKDQRKVRTELETLLKRVIPQQKALKFNYQQFYKQCCVFSSVQTCQKICISLTITEYEFLGGITYELEKKYQFVAKLVENYTSEQDQGDWFIISFAMLQHAIYKAQAQEFSGKTLSELQQKFRFYIQNNAFLPQGQIRKLYTTLQIIDDILEMARYFDDIREKIKDCMIKFQEKQNFVIKAFEDVQFATVEDTYEKLIKQFKIKDKNKIFCKNSKGQRKLALLLFKRQVNLKLVPDILTNSYNFDLCLKILKEMKQQGLGKDTSFQFTYKEFLQFANSINNLSDTKAIDVAVVDVSFFLKFLGFQFFYGFELIMEQIIIFKQSFDQVLSTVLDKARLKQFQQTIEQFERQKLKQLVFQASKSSINYCQTNLRLKSQTTDFIWKKKTVIPSNIFSQQYYSEKLKRIYQIRSDFVTANKPLVTNKAKDLYNLTQLIWKIYANQHKNKKKVKNFPFQDQEFINFSQRVTQLHQETQKFPQTACLQLFQKVIRESLFIASQKSQKQYQLIKFITQEKTDVFQKLQKTESFYMLLQELIQPKNDKNKEKQFKAKFKHYYLSKPPTRKFFFIGKNQSIKEDVEKFISVFLKPVFQKEEQMKAFIQRIYKLIEFGIKWQQKQKIVEVDIQVDSILQKLSRIVEFTPIISDTNKIISYIFATTFEHLNPSFPETKKMQFLGKLFHPMQKLIQVNTEFIKKWEDQILLFDAVEALLDCQFTKIIKEQLKTEKNKEQILFKKECIGMLWTVRKSCQKFKDKKEGNQKKEQQLIFSEFIEWIRKINTKINIDLSGIFDWSDQQKMIALVPKIQGQVAVEFFRNINVAMTSLLVEAKNFKIKNNSCNLILGNINKAEIKRLLNSLDGSHFNQKLESSAQFMLNITRKGSLNQQFFFGQIKGDIPANIQIHKSRGGTQNTFQAKIVKVSILKGYIKQKKVYETISITQSIVVGVGQTGSFEKLAQWINLQIK